MDFGILVIQRWFGYKFLFTPFFVEIKRLTKIGTYVVANLTTYITHTYMYFLILIYHYEKGPLWTFVIGSGPEWTWSISKIRLGPGSV